MLLRLRVGRSVVRAEASQHGALVWMAEAGYQDVAELADVIARLAAEAPAGCRRLEVALERPRAQLRTLSDVPPVKSRELKALVEHQASRYFRRNGQSLVTDAVWIGKGSERTVRAAAAEEPLVEAIAAGTRAAGLALTTIGPVDETTPLVLLPVSERARRERAAGRRVRRLAVATVAIWVAAGTLFVARLAWERRAVERELVVLERPLSAALAARRELRDAETTVTAVAAAERLRGRSLGTLARIAAALPDSAVLTSFAWSDAGTGLIAGAARRAADVIAAFDRAGAVMPRLEGPVVRETVAGRAWERFAVTFGGKGHD